MARRKPRRRRDPEPYQKYRQPLQQRWRPLILDRDKGRCRACKSREGPEMAHITDAVAFVRAAGHHRGVTFSYRWDNLYILCKACHKASHRFRVATEEELERKRRVQAIEEELRKVRGWSSPFAVLPPRMVPERLRPLRSFHDRLRISPLVPFPTFPRYAADGGLVFADEEAGPAQATLAPGDDGGGAEPARF